jgi:hypothetical protein
MTQPVNIKAKIVCDSLIIKKEDVQLAFDKADLPIVLEAFSFAEVADLNKVELNQITDLLARINLRLNKPS